MDRGAIVFVGSSAPSKVQAAVAKLQKAYPSGTVYGRAVNTTDDASIQSFFSWVDGKGSKGLDHLSKAFAREDSSRRVTNPTLPVLSAGDTISFNLLAQTDTSTLADPFQVRLFGIFRAVKAAQPLLNVGGSVTLTSGMSSRKPPGKGWALAGSIMGSVEVSFRVLEVKKRSKLTNSPPFAGPREVACPRARTHSLQRDMSGNSRD